MIQGRQQDLFKNPHFDGETYRKGNDQTRLTGQLQRVYELMKDGSWLTLTEIQAAMMGIHNKLDSESGIAARLRDLRKERFGAHTVDRRLKGAKGQGQYEYKLTIKEVS